jgi:DNA-binding CsgD family transcriptional regulator
MTDSGSQPSEDELRWARLTDKQRACLDLVLDHQTSKQIARRLDISKQAVDLRLKTARDTLGVANRAETAIIYARLKQTYDRIPCDPIILAPRPTLMPFDSSNGGLPEAIHDCGSPTGEPTGSNPPFGDFWRHDHARVRRVWIMAALLVGLALLILTGLSIAQALTRLGSG